MKAYRLHRYGGPDSASLDDIAEPQPLPNQLLVRTTAVALNPVDYKVRKGLLKLLLKLNLPSVMGCDVSGEVIATGAAVTRFKPGDRIIADLGLDGAFAEIVRVDESLAAAAPVSVDPITAAGLPLAALTALQALRNELRAGPGCHVLITAAAGGVGTFAIQLAKMMGAEVTVTASPRGEALVRELGADHVIDYTATDLAAGGRDFDAVFDLAGGETLASCFSRAKAGARIISIASMPTPSSIAHLDAGAIPRALLWLASFGLRRKAAANNVDYDYLFLKTNGADLAELAAMVDAGKLRIVIDRQFPFTEIADALAYLENGRAKGKVVVAMQDR